jgi:hypothetical protein
VFWEEPVADAGEGFLFAEGRAWWLEDKRERWWWWEAALGVFEFGDGGER